MEKPITAQDPFSVSAGQLLPISPVQIRGSRDHDHLFCKSRPHGPYLLADKLGKGHDPLGLTQGGWQEQTKQTQVLPFHRTGIPVQSQIINVEDLRATRGQERQEKQCPVEEIDLEPLQQSRQGHLQPEVAIPSLLNEGPDARVPLQRL
jgi:hypothetical protein